MNWPGLPSRRQPSTAMLIQTASSVDSVRVGLTIINGENMPRILAVTAPASRDGKASLACALAVTIARAGRKVCLVDADLEHPNLDRSVPVPANCAALCDVLVGRCSVDDVLYEWPEAGLTVVPAGSLPGNAAASRAMARIEQVLRELSERFDVVVVDTPPVLPVNDALAIPRVADATVVVVRYGKTKKESLAECFNALRLTGAEQVSTVMVGMSNRAWRKYSRRVADARQRLGDQPRVGTARLTPQSRRDANAAPAPAASATSARESASVAPTSAAAVPEPKSSDTGDAIAMQRHVPSHERGTEAHKLAQLTPRVGDHAAGRAARAPW